jgi:hypothetical protein
MTIDFILLTLTLNSAHLYSANNHDHLFQFSIVIANANVPPKRQTTPGFNHDQMQMGKYIVTNDTLSSHLHLRCKW